MAVTDTESGKKEKVSVSSKKQCRSMYTAAELAADADIIFGTTPECVLAALKEKDIWKCTKEEAEKIVKAFRERKVE